MNILFAVVNQYFHKNFAIDDRQRLAAMGRLIGAEDPPETITRNYLLDHVAEADVVITSWGTPALDAAIMERAQRLRLVTHAAGTVKPIVSEALWARGVRVTSSAAAISYGVAEFCLGMMLLAPKRTFWAGQAMREGKWADALRVFHGPRELYKQTVGVIGAGHVGRHLIRLLQNFDCKVVVYDPFLTTDAARQIGAEKVDDLKDLFRRSSVVSVNAPAIDATKGMIRAEHLQLMPDGALLINTARAAIIDQNDLIEELRRERIVACLDVTEVEPTPKDHPLRHLPNVWLTPHEAGAVAQNLMRIGTLVTDEIKRFQDGEPLKYEVTQEQLASIA